MSKSEEGKVVVISKKGLQAEVVVLKRSHETFKKGPKKGQPKMKSETRHLIFSHGSWVDQADQVYNID